LPFSISAFIDFNSLFAPAASRQAKLNSFHISGDPMSNLAHHPTGFPRDPSRMPKAGFPAQGRWMVPARAALLSLYRNFQANEWIRIFAKHKADTLPMSISISVENENSKSNWK
jgi:hypothetical protein